MRLPGDHPERIALNDELHARPPDALIAPLRVSFLAMIAEEGAPDRQGEQVAALAHRYGVAPPTSGGNHYSADLGPFRLKWEKHTEFSGFQFTVGGSEDEPFARPALEAVPADWLAALPGRVMVAAHVSFLPAAGRAPPDYADLAARYFRGHGLVGGAIAGGAALAVTDFRVHPDGFSRWLVRDVSLTPGQAGRAIQRLLEIDTYRMMALLGLPVARELGLALSRSERELAGITAALVAAREEDEPGLLERLIRLEAEIERRYADTLFRLGASTAYYGLVQRRVQELREQRITGLQTVQEFLERRLTPAMSTCQAVGGRQDSISRRVARASQLLATRVEITREGQSQALLASMNRRASLQLRLQETVEGLSIAAVTYYVVALIGHVAEGLAVEGSKIPPDLIEAASVPVVALLVWLGIRRIRRLVSRAE
jgi:uncharacterized membrane-anchored protein